jgi:hypothetical protein
MGSKRPLWLWVLLGMSIALLSPLTGCALTAHGRTQIIPFSSTPSGAEVFIDGQSRGFTPLTLELRRNQSYDVVLKYKDQEQHVTITNFLEGDKVALGAVPAAVGGGFALYVCINALSNVSESIEQVSQGISIVPVLRHLVHC